MSENTSPSRDASEEVAHSTDVSRRRLLKWIVGESARWSSSARRDLSWSITASFRVSSSSTRSTVPVRCPPLHCPSRRSDQAKADGSIPRHVTEALATPSPTRQHIGRRFAGARRDASRLRQQPRHRPFRNVTRQALALRVDDTLLSPMAMVTVDGGNGYWNPHPRDDPMAMVVHELIPFCQRKGLGLAPHQIGLMGISMGGYGALAMPNGTRPRVGGCRDQSRRLDNLCAGARGQRRGLRF